MDLSDKSKKRIIHFFSIILLVCMIIAFIGIIIIAFQIDIYDLLTGVQELKITVENQSNKTKDVYCYLQKTKTEPNISQVSDMNERYIPDNETESFIFEYRDPNKIRRVYIYVYNQSEGKQKSINSFYDFPKDKVYNLKVVIDEKGQNITITKAS